MEKSIKKINVGSGLDVRNGWDNLDLHKKYGANIIHDLTKLPLPIKNNTYDVVECNHVLEDFIEPLPLIHEMIRILKPNGILKLSMPHHLNLYTYNPRHKRGYSIHFLYGLQKESGNYDNSSQVLKILSAKYYIGSKGIGSLIGKLFALFYNLLGYKIVENTFIKYLCPIMDIKAVYKKAKK